LKENEQTYTAEETYGSTNELILFGLAASGHRKVGR
jgi:hypothetical protein